MSRAQVRRPVEDGKIRAEKDARSQWRHQPEDVARESRQRGQAATERAEPNDAGKIEGAAFGLFRELGKVDVRLAVEKLGITFDVAVRLGKNYAAAASEALLHLGSPAVVVIHQLLPTWEGRDEATLVSALQSTTSSIRGGRPDKDPRGGAGTPGRPRGQRAASHRAAPKVRLAHEREEGPPGRSSRRRKEAIAVATKLGRQAEELCLQQNKTIGKLTERNRELETPVRDLESGKKTSTTADAA